MNGSNSGYLYAAYIIVWVVHIAYAFTLMKRSRRMKRESLDLARR